MEWLNHIKILEKSAEFTRRFFYVIVSFFILGTLLLSWVSLRHLYTLPYTKDAEEITIIKGSGTWKNLWELYDRGILPHPIIVLVGYLGIPKIQAGDYLIEKELSANQVINILRNGKVIKLMVSFSEGMTVHEMIAHINTDHRLSGMLKVDIPEGMLFPATYYVHKHDTKDHLIKIMMKKMKTSAEDIMKTNQNPFIKTWQELIIFASILQKEAANTDEMPRISGIFVNRLKKNMLLQSCPTVIYAKNLGKIKFSGILTYRDLKIDSLYNTYLYKGLPVGPICCPGLAALKAAANPLSTNELFFIFDGKKHHFSVNYQQHLNQKNQIQKKLNGPLNESSD